MQFYEVEPALREGKKIKLDTWENAYWYHNQDGKLINHDENGYERPIKQLHPIVLTVWLTADSWQVVEDDVPSVDTPVPVPDFSFSVALDYIKQGKKVARKGWNGKGMFLFLADDIEFSTAADLSCVKDLEGDLTAQSIVLKTADDKFVVGWLASQTDMLADDWNIVE